MAANEQLAVLKKGEGVFTPGQMKAPASSSTTPYTWVALNPGDAQQLGKTVAGQIESMMTDWAIKQKRHGGLLATWATSAYLSRSRVQPQSAQT
jgi:hypothetical protein